MICTGAVMMQCHRQQDGEQGDVMQHQQEVSADEGFHGPQGMLLVVLVPFDAEAVVVTEQMMCCKRPDRENKERICVSCVNLPSPRTNLHGNAAMAAARAELRLEDMLTATSVCKAELPIGSIFIAPAAPRASSTHTPSSTFAFRHYGEVEQCYGSK
ncbi:hypothetical protein EYF80_042443 [Liparis tanakae]|uniref:Uncharacterized protein n=1 Tax=Liparis tanakae TaxID=230148 RepID=A0A4Z2G2P4_9TELE|nr:hypothetical protein EYF80_042443 [Liparis tanakae]